MHDVPTFERLTSYSSTPQVLDFRGAGVGGVGGSFGNVPNHDVGAGVGLCVVGEAVGTAVGFVGAAESKQALLEEATRKDIPFITVLGRRGGSAIASAALNSIAMGTA